MGTSLHGTFRGRILFSYCRLYLLRFLAGLLLLGGFCSADSAEVDLNPPHDVERPGGTTPDGKKVIKVDFFHDDDIGQGKGSSGSNTADLGSGGGGEPGLGESTGGNGPDPHFDGIRQGVGAMFAPFMQGLNSTINNWIGGNAGRDVQREIWARSVAYRKYITEQIPKERAQLEAKIVSEFSKGLSLPAELRARRLTALDRRASDMGNNERLRSLLLTTPFATPSDENYKAMLKGSLQPLVDHYKEIHRVWNGDGEVFGLGGSLEPQANSLFLFDEGSFLNRNAAIAKSAEEDVYVQHNREVFEKTDLLAGVNLKVQIELLREWNRLENVHLSGERGREGVSEYEFRAPKSEDRSRLEKIYSNLESVRPKSTTEQRSKRIGIDAVKAGDRALIKGDKVAARYFGDIGESMFDIATGTLPVISWGRDVYETISGRDLISGEKLTEIERIGALIGSVTGGAGGAIARSGRIYRQIDSKIDPVRKRVLDYLGDRADQIISFASKVTGKELRLSRHAANRALQRGNLTTQSVERIVDFGKPYLDRGATTESVAFWAKRRKLVEPDGRDTMIYVAVSPKDKTIKTIVEERRYRSFEQVEKAKLPGGRRGPRWLPLPRKGGL